MRSFSKLQTTLCLLILSINSFSYAQVSVDHYHGTALVDVPIYTIGLNGFSLPIKLSYAAGGIKVNQLASDAGLGWNLVAGGEVIRVVRDVPDDLHYSYGSTKVGWIFNSAYANNNHIIQNINIADTANCDNVVEFEQFTRDYLDLEPDVYRYSGSTIQGEFVLDEYQIEDTIKVYKTLQTNDSIYVITEGLEILGYYITDTKGAKYFFDIPEYLKTFVRNQVSGDPKNEYHSYELAYDNAGIRIGQNINFVNNKWTAIDSCISTWKLSKIITPQNEEIIFVYEPEITPVDKSFYKLYHRYDQNGQLCKRSETEINPDTDSIYSYINGYRLKSIETSQINVVFAYENKRIDVPQRIPDKSKECKTLDNIKVYAKTNESVLLKEYRFAYSYFGSTSSNVYLVDNSALWRLRLDDVTISSGNNSLGKYSFGYDYSDTRKLPSRFSKAQDVWGYFNGAVNDTTLVPTIYIYPGKSGPDRYSVYPDPLVAASDTLHYGNRLPSADYTGICTLNKITYPTGGQSTLEYEPNKFAYSGSMYSGPGLRINKLTTAASAGDTKPITELYTYGIKDGAGSETASFGKITRIPQYGFFDPTWDWPAALGFNLYNAGYAAGNMDLNDYADGVFGYSKVIITYGNNEEGGRSELTFSNEAMYREPDTYLNRAATSSVLIKASVDCFYAVQAWSSVLQLSYGWAYPYANNPNYNWCRGMPKSRRDFDANGNLVHSSVTQYENYFLNNSPKIVYGIKYGLLVNNRHAIPQPLHPLLGPVTLCSKYEIITGACTRPAAIIDTTFDLASSQRLITKTELFYNAYNQPASAKTYNSDGSINESRTTYPTDFDYSGTTTDDRVATMKKMSTVLNMIDYPVETTAGIERNSSKKIINGEVITYRELMLDNGKSIITPSQRYTTENESPIAGFTPLMITNGSGNYLEFDDNYTVSATYKYNPNYGNLVQTCSYDSTFSSLAYALSGKIVTAGISNASSGECAYWGFEYGQDPGLNIVVGTVQKYPIGSDNVFTGHYSLKLTTSNYAYARKLIYKRYEQHSGYKISAWVKGQGAYISLGVYNQSATFKQASNTATDGKWHLLEVELPVDLINDYNSPDPNITLEARLGIAGNESYFDDVRFMPMDATMQTSVYDDKFQLVASTDANNMPVRYTYDEFGRLVLVTDHLGNILKKYVYNIAK